MKKLLSLTLVLTLILGTLAIFPASAVTTENTVFEKDGYRYYLNEDGTANFSGCTEKREELIIPAEIDGHKIVAIYGLSINNKKDLKSVTLPEGVVELGYHAFDGCLNLEKIDLPDSLTDMNAKRIENTNFYRTKENWEDGVLYAGNHLVKARNQELKGSYKIKDGTVAVSNHAFEDCGFLTEVIFPDTLKHIGDFAFDDCNVLEKVILPDSLESMGIYAFDGCNAIEEIRLSENLEVIPMGAFRNAKISALEIPQAVKEIDDYAFSNCVNLTEVTIPEGVEVIGYSAFSRCENLEKITLPESLKDLGNGAFYGTAYFKNEANWENGCLYLGDVLLDVDENAKNITVKDGTTILPRQAFSNNEKLVSVTLPDSIEQISPYCFAFSYYVRSIKLPENLKVIGSGAFEDCVAIESIKIPEGVTTIENGAFLNCQKLKYVEIPPSVATIDEMALGYYNPYFQIGGMPVIPESYPIVEGFTIAGYKGTTAEKYAKDNNITFVDLSEASVFKYNEKVMELLKDYNIVHYSEVCYNADYVLIRAYSDLVMEADFIYHFKDYMMYETSTSTPAEFGYFIYLPEKNEIYTLVNAFEKGIDGVYDIFTQGILGDLTGDVNFDGKVNIRDATTIQKDVARKASIIDNYYMAKDQYDPTRATKIADFNRDSKLNIKDATAIQKTLAKVDINNPNYEDFENSAYENSIKHSSVTLGDKVYDLRSDETMTVNIYLTSDKPIKELTFEMKQNGYIRRVQYRNDAEFIKNHLPNLPAEYKQFKNYTDYTYIQTPEGEMDFSEKKLLFTMDYQLDSEGEVTLNPIIRSAYSTEGKALCSHNEPLNGADFYLTYEVTFERLP